MYAIQYLSKQSTQIYLKRLGFVLIYNGQIKSKRSFLKSLFQNQSEFLTAPAATKNSTNISDKLANTGNAGATSSQNIFNALQPGSREEAVSSSNQDITITGTTVSFGHLFLGKFSKCILQDYILLFTSWDRDCWSNSNEESKGKDNFHLEEYGMNCDLAN